jgi:hypothetical protein
MQTNEVQNLGRGDAIIANVNDSFRRRFVRRRTKLSHKDVIMGTRSKQTNGSERARKPNSRKHIDRAPDTNGESPEASMSVESLMKLGAAEFGEFSRLDEEAMGLARRSTIAFFRAGRAWSLAKGKVSDRTWGKLLDKHNIPRSSAWEAIELFNRAEQEEAISGMTRAAALKKFDIRQPKKASATSAANNVPDRTDQDDDEPAEADSEEQDERGAADEDEVEDENEVEDDDEVEDEDEEADDDADEDEVEDEDDDADEDEVESDEDEVENDEDESDEDADQAQPSSPLEAMDEVLAWLDTVDRAIAEIDLDLDHDEFLEKVQQAQDRLVAIRDSVVVAQSR